jgi:geranylgeranyl diphosphate synthase type I
MTTTTTSDSVLSSVLATGREALEPALRDAVRTYLSPELGRIADYHIGWADADGRPVSTWGGKLVRPTLALLSARAANGTVADGVPAAVAMELVHNFSLLHDDIMDGDTTRRGRETAWTAFGVPGAILAGDAMVAAATSVLLDSDGKGAASAAGSLMTSTQRMISGQGADVSFEQRSDVTLAECVQMAGDKTGALLSCACSLGADLVGADRALVGRLAAFGEHIGLAFQLVDDMLGIWGEEKQTGKQVGADLRVRKKSLPVVAALNAAGSEELAGLYFRPEPLSEQDVQRVTALVERGGGRDWARDEAARQLASAEECLTAAGIADPVRHELQEIAGFIVGRRF